MDFSVRLPIRQRGGFMVVAVVAGSLLIGGAGWLIHTWRNWAKMQALEIHRVLEVVSSFRGPASPKPEGFEDLSAREREVLESLAKGLLYKEIAESLGISYATVNNHVRNIYRKLHVNSRTAAVTAWFAARGRGHG